MLKILFAPIRLASGWGFSPRLLSVLGVAMLVILRLTIGWHFFSEGVDKRRSGNWTATPFFANARGPLAERFRGMVWDQDGSLRLNRDRTMTELNRFRLRAVQHYGFDEQQDQRSKSVLKEAGKDFDWIVQQNAADLEEFEFGKERLKSLQEDERQRRNRDGVTSLGEQRDAILREWRGKGASTLTQMNKLWNAYEASINALATREQVKDHDYLRIGQPSNSWMDTATIDWTLPYFDIVIGLLLLLGLFTPAAALAAAVFLGSVFLSQYPPDTGPSSTMYQLIESMACLVLAATGAGRFAGLDFFLHLIHRRIYGRGQSEFQTKLA